MTTNNNDNVPENDEDEEGSITLRMYDTENPEEVFEFNMVDPKVLKDLEEMDELYEGIKSMEPFEREVSLLMLPQYIKTEFMKVLGWDNIEIKYINSPDAWKDLKKELLGLSPNQLGAFTTTRPRDQRRFVLLQIPTMMWEASGVAEQGGPVLSGDAAKSALDLDKICESKEFKTLMQALGDQKLSYLSDKFDMLGTHKKAGSMKYKTFGDYLDALKNRIDLQHES